MATKMKGIYKGIKFISHLFVVREREIEIGYPTDVKHVAHIGLDGPDGSAPSWMNEFKTGPDFSLSSLGSIGGSKNHSVGGSGRNPTWTSQADFEGSVGRQQTSDIFNNFPPTNLSSASKKQRRKKVKSSSKKSDSSPRSGSSRSSLMSRKSTLGQETESSNT